VSQGKPDEGPKNYPKAYEKAWQAVLTKILITTDIKKKYGVSNVSRIKKRLSRAVEFILLFLWLYPKTEYGKG
jgi:hypothetical protein